MYRNEFISTIGYVRILDRTCEKCGGMYASKEHNKCPKCSGSLIVPSYATDNGPKPYGFTEVTLYPIMTEKKQANHLKRTNKAKGLLHTIRMVLWSKYDKERNLLVPDARVPYLVKDRTIRTCFHNPPLMVPFTTKKKEQKIELKYNFDYRDGDQLQFLDKKQESEHKEKESKKPEQVEQKTTTLSDSVLESMMARLEELEANAANKDKSEPQTVKKTEVGPSPNPEDSYAEEYVPSDEEMARANMEASNVFDDE